MSQNGEIIFRSDTPFDPTAPRALYIGCIDGRFFEHQAKHIADLDFHTDGFFVPGGIGNFNPLRIGGADDLDLDLSEILSIVGMHPSIREIFMNAHHDCGFYKECMKGTPDRIRFQAQLDDLEQFTHALRRSQPQITIRPTYTFVEDNVPTFRELYFQS